MILNTKPDSWNRYQRALPEGYAVISNKEALDPKNRQVLVSAREFINRNVLAHAKIGHREFKTIDGRKMLFVVEPHYHEPNGPTRPWGWHKGATVFVPPVNDYWAFLYDDAGFGLDVAVKGKTIAQRFKRFAIPAGITVAVLLNPIAGGILAGSVFVAKMLRPKVVPMKSVSPDLKVHKVAQATR